MTGEEFVLLSLIEAVLSVRGTGESMRSAFFRARDCGALDGIPGLIYPRGERDGVVEELIDTGMQRLVGDLDELPHPVLGYRLLEPPSRSTTLSPRALPANRVRWNSPISSLVMTFGCKFACPYCPIPAYNQRQHRLKSASRIADEMWQLNKDYGLRYFFGTDDNFFNNKARALEIVETLARAEFEGVPLRRKARWYTEVTVHDTLQMKEHLPLVRKAGCRALWLGVEDMTATLVNKGQSVNKTTEAFRLMREAGICPMPMMMHHDSQPLYSPGTNYGLLNQVHLLRKAGAVSLQVLMMTPSPGTKLYEETFEKRLVLGERRRKESAAVYVRWKLRGRFEPPAAVAEAGQSASELRVHVQPTMAGVGAVAVEHKGRPEARGHADRRHDRADPEYPPHQWLGDPDDVRADSAVWRSRHAARIPMRSVSGDPAAHARASVTPEPRSKTRVPLPLAV